MADNILHETNRYTKTARATQNTCGEAAPRRPRDSRNCSNARGIAQLCSSLEGCTQKRRTTSTGQQVASVKAMQTIREATLKTSKASFKRPQGKWLQNRLVDTTAYRSVDTETFRHKLSYRTCLANSPKAGLELPEARETCQRTRRTGHRILAKERLVSYKKKPVEPAEPSYWPMKAVLCLPQPFDVLGPQKDKHPFNTAGIEETDSRPSLRSVSRRCVTDLVCISPFRIAISGCMILKHLYRCCWSTFQRVLSWLSTAGWFIAGQKEDCVRGFPSVSILNGFQLMLLNLIRSNRFGITASTATLPTTFLMMYLHLRKLYVSLLSIFVHKNLCYIRSSKKPVLKYDSFH